MIKKIFLSINDTYFIRKDISNKKLNDCISFISRQGDIKKDFIKKFYKNKLEKKVILPKIYRGDVDIIIKTKINKNYKYIDLVKQKIFYKQINLNDISLRKINKYQLNNIKFFPKTFISNSYIYQNLAKGSLKIPDKISNIDKNLLSNISLVINCLSKNKQKSEVVSEYLYKFRNSKIKDNLNLNIINNYLSLLKNYKNEKIKTSLTHGDLKFDHLFILNKKLEYVIDWENIKVRSIYFDIFNLFIPWFSKRSHNYLKIKKYIKTFINKYLPQLNQHIENNYDLYFCIYALERYERIGESYSNKSDIDTAYKRFNSLFYKLVNEIKF